MKSRIQSIQVGQPRQHGISSQLGFSSADEKDQAWFSGFEKSEVKDPIEVTAVGLTGDDQADKINHGGPDKALLCYSASHFEHWQIEFNRSGLKGGMFGENLTLEHGTEEDVCIGDTFAVGNEVVVQVSQPRQPCWKLGRFWNEPLLPKKVIKTGFCGWYLRVIKAGTVETSMNFELVDRPHPDWNIRRAHRVMYAKKSDADFSLKSELAVLQQLSDSWKNELQT
jgi:MOSC domain-containing protein YiiM